MKTITLYTFNELNPKAQEKAIERYRKRMPMRIDIAKEILSNTKDSNFEFLADGTRIQIIEG
jgi:hypothetical protein